MGDGRVDGVLGHVTLDARVVTGGGIRKSGLSERTALLAHFVRCLPGAHDHLAYTPHRLAIGRNHRKSADIMEDILGCDGLATNAALGEGNVLRNRGVEMVAHHEHIQMLVQRIDGIWARRVGGRRQHVGFAAHSDDVGCVPATSAFGVIGVDDATLDRGQRRLDKARLVERIGMDRHLRIGLVGHGQAIVDRCGSAAPVLVQLESHRTRFDLLGEWPGQGHIALAQQPDIDRIGLHRLKHARQMPGPGRHGRGERPRGGARAAADHRGDPGGQRLFDLLRADQVDMAVDPARGHDHALGRDHLGRRPDDNGHARLDIRISGLANPADAPILDTDVRLDDAPPVDDERIGDDGVDAILAHALRLAHAVADHLATAELDLLSVNREILLHHRDEGGIRQSDPVTRGRTEHFGISLPGYFHLSSPPMTAPVKP